ncbi:MAG: hypothetical protein ACRDGL_02790 [Candidatus Limnocylindrales bacterium]
MTDLLRVAAVHLRTQRFELFAVLVVGVVAALATTIEAARLQALAPSAACLLARFSGAGVSPPSCPSPDAFIAMDNREVARLMAAMAVVPAIIGLLATSTLVSSEVEHRSAQLAWVLAPSRRRWLCERLLVAGGVLVVATSLAALGSLALERVRVPWFDPGASFADFGLSGPLVLARAIAFAGLGLLAGAVTGRQVPAVITGAMAITLLFLALSALMPYGLPAVPIRIDGPPGASLLTGIRFRAPDGTLITYSEVVQRAPPGLDDDARIDWIDEHYPGVSIGLPASEAPQVALREGALLGAVAVTSVAGSFVVVGRRRPYP